MPDDPVKFFKALGEETRLCIVRCLLDSEHCACEFDMVTGRDQTTVSRHLRILVEGGVLKYRKDGRNVIYSIRDADVRKVLTDFGLRPLESCCTTCSTAGESKTTRKLQGTK